MRSGLRPIRRANPAWVNDVIPWERSLATPQIAMHLTLNLAAASAAQGFGPFAAIMLDSGGKIIEVGWNSVLSSLDSTEHAEIHCLRRAQKRLKSHTLKIESLGEASIFSSCAPCIQCYGAIYWSGVKHVYSAARTADAEDLGFDEGPVSPELWKLAKERKDINYSPDFCRGKESLLPFKIYAQKGGIIY